MLIKDRPEYQQMPKPLSFAPETTVSDAVKEMSVKNFGSSAVLDSTGALKGIFTERDLMRRVVAKDLDPTTVTLNDVMTKEVRVAKGEDNLVDWLRIMSNERFRHLPVVDENGKLLMMMSQGDFVSYTWPELLHRVSEQARASLGGRFYPLFIAAAVMIYTLLAMFIFNR